MTDARARIPIPLPYIHAHIMPSPKEISTLGPQSRAELRGVVLDRKRERSFLAIECSCVVCFELLHTHRRERKRLREKEREGGRERERERERDALERPCHSSSSAAFAFLGQARRPGDSLAKAPHRARALPVAVAVRVARVQNEPVKGFVHLLQNTGKVWCSNPLCVCANKYVISQFINHWLNERMI